MTERLAKLTFFEGARLHSLRKNPQTPRYSPPGSPHSKKLSLSPHAARTTKFRTATPPYRLWNRNGTGSARLRFSRRAETAAGNTFTVRRKSVRNAGHDFKSLP
jgi:hypothetical protein